MDLAVANLRIDEKSSPVLEIILALPAPRMEEHRGLAERTTTLRLTEIFVFVKLVVIIQNKTMYCQQYINLYTFVGILPLNQRNKYRQCLA